jgi:hypothetical protein
MFPALVLASALLAPLSPGEHAVGFRIVVETDAQRPALAPGTGMGRQLPIAIWYPAQGGASEPLRLRDYVVAGEQALVGIEPADHRAPIDAFAADALARGIPHADVERLLNTHGIAVREAAAAPGRFPLLLFAHGSVETESVTCEYLASYGYVVAAVRSRGASDPVYKLSRAPALVPQRVAHTRVRAEYASCRLPGLPGIRAGSAGILRPGRRR